MQSLDFVLMMSMIALLTIFVLMFILSGVKVVSTWERVVILRLGLYLGVRGPGIIWKTPILDKIALRISLRVQSTDIDTGKYVSSDGSSRRLKGIVQWKVLDVEKFALSIEDHYITVNRTIHHHVMKVAESMTSDAVFSDSYELDSQVKSSIEPIFSEWGLTVTKVELRTAHD